MGNILHWGMDFAKDEKLRQKVYLSNIIAIIVALGIALPFVFISLYLFPALTFLPLWAVAIGLFIPVLNRLGQIQFSRILLSLVPISLASAYQAGLMQGDEPIGAIQTIQISFALLPFIIFDLKERGKMLFTSAWCLLAIVGFRWWDPLLVYPADSALLRHGFMGFLTTLLAALLGLSMVYLMALFNQRLERNLLSVMSESDEKAKALEEAQYQMKQNLQELEAAREEERNRSWVGAGLNEVDKLVKQNQGNENLYSIILSFIIKYLEANQGVLYLVEENPETQEPEMVPVSAYAWGRLKRVKEPISKGVGLVGQCYLEQEIIYMTDVPDTYVRIRSGLGQSNPKCIVIAPLLYNEEVQAIMELAAFSPLNAFQMQFVKEVCENLASTIYNQKINERTRLLYEESQQQAEQMKSQEEELRQNLEELEATQEQQHRVEEEMKEKQRQLEEALAKALKDKEEVIRLYSNNSNLKTYRVDANQKESVLQDK